VSRTPRLLLERLDSRLDVSTFTSGSDVLDGWLRRHALAAQRFSPRHCARQSLPGRSLPHVLSWWTLSTKKQLLFTGATVSSKYPRIHSGFTAA
jgi:hypothetical protein